MEGELDWKAVVALVIVSEGGLRGLRGPKPRPTRASTRLVLGSLASASSANWREADDFVFGISNSGVSPRNTNTQYR